jgi:hypothetical protein
MGDIAPVIALVDPEMQFALLDTVTHVMRYIHDQTSYGVTTRYSTGSVNCVDVWATPESGEDEFVFGVRCEPKLGTTRRVHASMRWRGPNDGRLHASRGFFLVRSIEDISRHLPEAVRSYERARANSLQWG